MQGYLLRNKTRPRESVEEAPAWFVLEFPALDISDDTDCRVTQEREMRAKMKKGEKEVKLTLYIWCSYLRQHPQREAKENEVRCHLNFACKTVANCV